jgi:hypothetical protein
MFSNKYLANNQFTFVWMTIKNSQFVSIDNNYIMISQKGKNNKNVNGNKNTYKS